MATDVKGVAMQFVNHYYDTFDKDRSQLASLYTDVSQLSFEGNEFQGPEAIVKKLMSLPFKNVKHAITTIDVQTSPLRSDMILIAVLGQLKTDDDPPHSFFQSFTLAAFNNSLVVINDIFRLVLHSI